MRLSKSFFILSREIFDSAIWRDSPDVLKLWIYLIGIARFDKEPKKFPGFVVKRGELVTSLAQIAENNEYEENGTAKQWSRMKVSRMLKKLAEQGYIEQRCDTYGTHVSICNYDIYQDVGRYKANSHDTTVLRGCDESVTVVLPYNNDNNGNNGKKEERAPSKIKYAEFVTMTEAEYSKLVDQYGEANVERMISKLDNYKGAKGKTYKSDYRAMLSWVADEVMKSPGQPTQRKLA